MSKPEIKVDKKSERKPDHPLYMAFCNAKSVALELARTIATETGKDTKSDVRRFLEEFERKTA